MCSIVMCQENEKNGFGRGRHSHPGGTYKSPGSSELAHSMDRYVHTICRCYGIGRGESSVIKQSGLWIRRDHTLFIYSVLSADRGKDRVLLTVCLFVCFNWLGQQQQECNPKGKHNILSGSCCLRFPTSEGDVWGHWKFIGVLGYSVHNRRNSGFFLENNVNS
jgi:hypothetical protein